MIYLSSAFSKGRTIKDSVEKLALQGCRNIELTGGTTYYNGYVNDLITLREKYYLKYLIHNYFPPPEKDFVLNITSPDTEVRTRSLIFLENSLNLCGKMGVPFYSFHAGYTKQLKPEKKGIYFSIDETFRNDGNNTTTLFFDNMASIVRKAEKAGCKIAVENLFPVSETENFSLMCTPVEIETFLRHFESCKNVGLLLDLGHLNISSYYLHFDKIGFLNHLISNYRDRIFEVHVSENSGFMDEHRISTLDSWQLKLIKDNYEVFKDIPITLEWHSQDDGCDLNKYNMILKYLEE